MRSSQPCVNRSSLPPAPLLQLAAAPPPPQPAANGAAGPRLITMAEVEKHTTKESAWFVSDGKVYDATPFLKEHPGGQLWVRKACCQAVDLGLLTPAQARLAAPHGLAAACVCAPSSTPLLKRMFVS